MAALHKGDCCVLTQIQSSIGHSDYVKRDQALKGLIQPLAGEYGMHNGQAQGAQPRPLLPSPSPNPLPSTPAPRNPLSLSCSVVQQLLEYLLRILSQYVRGKTTTTLAHHRWASICMKTCCAVIIDAISLRQTQRHDTS